MPFDLYTPKTPDHHKLRERGGTMYNTNLKEVVEAVIAQYPSCYKFTRQYEGGYVNDPDDPGGCTNMGITIGTLQDWREDDTITCDDVKNLSEPEVGLIYAVNYWMPVWGNDLPVGLNCPVWDWGVNSGPSRAVEYLQRMVGSSADGLMGPKTLDATENYCAKVGIDTAIDTYRDLRQNYYESLSTFSKYGDGWTRRNNDCTTLAHSLAAGHDEGSGLPPGSLAWRLEVMDQRISELERWRKS